MAMLDSIYITLRQMHFCSNKLKIKKANHTKNLIDILATNTINSIEQKKSLAKRKKGSKTGFLSEKYIGSYRCEGEHPNRTAIHKPVADWSKTFLS